MKTLVTFTLTISLFINILQPTSVQGLKNGDFGMTIPQTGSMIKIDNVHLTLGDDTTKYYPPNYSFENWEKAIIENPVGWTSSNNFLGPYEDNVTKTTDSYSGNYAARLERKDYIYYDVPGILVYGEEGFTDIEGAPFNEFHEYFSFAYKYIPNGSDTATLSYFFSKDGMFYGGEYIRLNATTDYEVYTGFSGIWEIPDTMRIFINAGENIGSVLYVDDLKFKNSLHLFVDPQFTGNAYDLTNEGPYAQGDIINVYASPEPDYEFLYWTNSTGDQVSTDSMFNYTMPNHTDTLIAHFVHQSTPKYELTLISKPENAGNLIGNGFYYEGIEVLVEAHANEYFNFVNWTDNTETVISDSSSFKFLMPDEHISLTANFILKEYMLTLKVEPANSGTVTGDGMYEYDSEVIITAEANKGFKFLYWTDYKDSIVANDTSISFDMPGFNLLLRAHFDEVTGLVKSTKPDILIYPNPVIGHINVINNEIYEFQIINIMGKSFLSGSFPKGQNKLDLNHLSKGMYFILLYNETDTQVIKIIKD